MNRTPLRQSEYETSVASSASRMPIIDAAVGRLQVQMEEVIARLDAIGDTDAYRKGHADGVQEAIDHANRFGE